MTKYIKVSELIVDKTKIIGNKGKTLPWEDVQIFIYTLEGSAHFAQN